MMSYYAYPQFCSLAPPPPRTPARPDPQVPADAQLGPARWGKIGAFYFYVVGSDDDAAFGLFDMEFSLQRLPKGKARLEIYAIADGYQRGGASGLEHPLRIRLMHGARQAATVDWPYPNILDGNADPMSWSHDFELAADLCDGVDRIEIAAARDAGPANIRE